MLRIIVIVLNYSEIIKLCVIFADFPGQCWDGKNKTYNIGKYYPLLHTSCKQMWCRDDFVLIKEE